MIVETIFASIGSWILENYGKDIAGKSLEFVKEKWAKFSWEKAAQIYQERMQEQHSTIRVLGKSSPIELEGIFTDVYILDELTAQQRFNIEALKLNNPTRFDRYHSQKRIHGLKLVTQKKGHRLFILGKPGSGKTTFLKYITLKAIEGKINKVPIFVSLKEWSISGETELLPFIVKQFEVCHFPDAQSFIEHMLNDGQAIVLFDGLDEVNQENNQRGNLTHLLQNFARQYPVSQCLITCRIAASEYAFEGFQDVEIADFTDEQINNFVNKWFQYNETKRKAFLQEFRAPKNEGVRELANIPILLSLLCLTFEANMQFPQQRAEIYYDALDALLRRWDKSRSIQRDEIYEKLTPKRKQHMFAHIAAVTFEKGDYFISQRRLEKLIFDYLGKLAASDEIDGRQILKAIEAQHSIFVERAKGIYAFSHLTFQEYFTAKYIADNETRALKGLFSHLTDYRWREVFLLTASLLDEADDFFKLFKKTVDEMVAGDPVLLQVLYWADEKARATNSSSTKIASIRYGYLKSSSLFVHTQRQEETGENLLLLSYKFEGYTLYISNIIAFEHSIINNSAIELVLMELNSSSMNFDFDSNLALDFNLAFAIGIFQVFGLVDIETVRPGYTAYISYFNQVVDLSKEIDTSLYLDLSRLTIPTKSAPRTAWAALSKELQNIVQTHRRDISNNEWNLSDNQTECISSYLDANELLANCLRVADYISNRQTIETELFLPSKQP